MALVGLGRSTRFTQGPVLADDPRQLSPALRHLRDGGDSEYLNLGNGTGYSVREVLEATRKVTGLEVPFDDAPRREGDPPRLVGNAQRARQVLGWEPKRPALEEIIRSAWEWQKIHPRGYETGA